MTPHTDDPHTPDDWLEAFESALNRGERSNVIPLNSRQLKEQIIRALQGGNADGPEAA